MPQRMDQKPAASSVSNTDIVIVANPTTGAMKKATAQQIAARTVETTLTDAPDIIWNFNNGNVAKVTLGGNRTLSISNVPAKSFGLLLVFQDSTGSRTLSLPGIVPAGWLLSTEGNAVDMLGFYYDGSTYYWSVNGASGGSSGTIALTSTNFAAEDSLAGGVWTTSATDSSWNHPILFVQSLAAGKAGRIYLTGPSGSGNMSGFLAFKTSNTLGGYTTFLAAFYLQNDGKIIFNHSGGSSGGDTGQTWTAGHFYALFRDSSGDFHIQESTDETSWTTVYTFSVVNNTGLLYIAGDILGASFVSIKSPKGNL
jgi:hypothetical protein